MALDFPGPPTNANHQLGVLASTTKRARCLESATLFATRHSALKAAGDPSGSRVAQILHSAKARATEWEARLSLDQPSETLIEVERLQCKRESVNEDWLLACFWNSIQSNCGL